MTQSPHISDVGINNFVAEVIERSQQTPVLVDFWAEWCGPCKSLAPVLEKLVDEYAGAVHLAKVDTDAEQMLAAQAGIRSLPTVMLFVGGQPVDQFQGALPEGQIREFLATHGINAGAPAPEDNLLAQAEALLEQGQAEAAAQLLRQAQQEEPENGDILIMLGRACLQLRDLPSVKTLLEILPESHQKHAVAGQMRGYVRFAEDEDLQMSLPALMALEAPDSEQRYQIGVKQAIQGDIDAAAEAFFGLLMRDRSHREDGGRTALIALIELLGEDPRAGKLRRRLFTLMH